MAKTLFQVITERRSVLKQLHKLIVTVDSSVEKTRRKIKSLRARKNKVPEVQDLEYLTQLVIAIDRNLDTMTSGIREATAAFQQ